MPGVFHALNNHKGKSFGRPNIISKGKKIQIIGTVKKLDPVEYDKEVFTKSLSIAEYPDTFFVIMTENGEVEGALNFVLKEGYDVLMNCRELEVTKGIISEDVRYLCCNYMSFKGMVFGIEEDKEKATASDKFQELAEILPVNIDDSNFNTVIEHSYKKPVLIDFFANWCHPCKILEPTFNKMAEEKKNDILFARVNIDKSPGLAAKYKVRGIPTMVLIVKGKAVKVQTGAGRNDGENRNLINSIIAHIDNGQ